jgi:hypothetical protein
VVAAWERDLGRQPLETGRRSSITVVIVLSLVNVVAGAVPLFPGMKMYHDLGLPMYSALLWWAAGIGVLWTLSRSRNQDSTPTIAGVALAQVTPGVNLVGITV